MFFLLLTVLDPQMRLVYPSFCPYKVRDAGGLGVFVVAEVECGFLAFFFSFRKGGEGRCKGIVV